MSINFVHKEPHQDITMLRLVAWLIKFLFLSRTKMAARTGTIFIWPIRDQGLYKIGLFTRGGARLTLELMLNLLRLSCFNFLLALTGVKVEVKTACLREGVIGFGVLGSGFGAEAWSRPRILGWVLGLLLGELLAPEGWGRFRLLGWALDLLLSGLWEAEEGFFW